MPSEEPQFIVAWTLQCVKSVPQGCTGMLTPMLPTVVSSWLDDLWVVDHSLYTQETVKEKKNPAMLQFLTHSNRCAWNLLPYTVQKALQSFVLPIHPLNGTHTFHVSRFKTPYFTCLTSPIYTYHGGFNR